MALDNTLAEIRGHQQELRDMLSSAEKLGGGDGGAGGSMSEDWKANVDSQLGRLHDDVRHLWAALVGGVVLLATVGGGAYALLSSQVSDLRVGMAQANGRLDTTNAKIDAIDKKIDGIDSKLDHVLERKPTDSR